MRFGITFSSSSIAGFYNTTSLIFLPSIKASSSGYKQIGKLVTLSKIINGMEWALTDNLQETLFLKPSSLFEESDQP